MSYEYYASPPFIKLLCFRLLRLALRGWSGVNHTQVNSSLQCYPLLEYKKYNLCQRLRENPSQIRNMAVII